MVRTGDMECCSLLLYTCVCVWQQKNKNKETEFNHFTVSAVLRCLPVGDLP